MSDANEKNGVFLDGKNQVIELLKSMGASDKTTLLKNLRLRNPVLAKELSEQCFHYNNIWELSDESLENIFQHTKPIVIGLALHMTSTKNQRRALSLLGREQALKAYEIMTQDLSSHRSDCLKAQEKILEVALDLSRRKIIQFF